MYVCVVSSHVDALPQRSEFDVTTSSDSRIVSLIPGLKEIRRRTLPQMYFKRCKVHRGTFGRVHPPFNSEDDAVLIMWKPGKYQQVFFMFVSQLSPHHEQFLIDHWSMIVFEAETTGAVKRVVTPDEVALEDPRDQPPDRIQGINLQTTDHRWMMIWLMSQIQSRGNSSILIQMMKI